MSAYIARYCSSRQAHHHGEHEQQSNEAARCTAETPPPRPDSPSLQYKVPKKVSERVSGLYSVTLACS